MNNTKFFDLLGEIDDKFYEEVLGGDSEKPIKIVSTSKPFSIKRVAVPIAACLVLGAGAFTTLHFLDKSGTIVPPFNTSDNSVNTSDNSGSSGEVILTDVNEADIAACKELIRERFPNIDSYADNSLSGTKIRVIDVDFDGANEVLVLPNAKNSKLFIFDKTADGMKESGAIDDPGIFFLNENLFKYDSDDGQYWYYYDARSNGTTSEIYGVAKIGYGSGGYRLEYPLVYGYSSDEYGGTKKWFFKTDCTGEDKLMSYVGKEQSSNVSNDEFKARWEKHEDLPEFEYHLTFDEEYPMFDNAKVPVLSDPYTQSQYLLPNAVFDVRDMGEYRLCLIGSDILRFSDTPDDIVYMGSLWLGIEKDGKILSSEGFGCFVSSATSGFGQFALNTNMLDKYINNIFTLEDGTQLIEFRYEKAGEKFGVETAFVAVKNDTVIRLFGSGYDVGDLGSLTLAGNTLIDAENGVEYSFSPDAFEGNPYDVPHFVKYNTISEYPRFSGEFNKVQAKAELTVEQCGEYTVRLLGHNVEKSVAQEFPIVRYSELYLALEKDGKILSKLEAGPGSINGSVLDSYLKSFKMNGGNGFVLYHGLDPYGANYGFGALYAVRNDEIVVLRYEHDYAPIVSGTPTYIGSFDVTPVNALNNTIATDMAGDIIINFETGIYSINAQ